MRTVACIDGPCAGELVTIDDRIVSGDIVQVRTPVKPITIDEMSSADVVNPMTEAGARYYADRMTEGVVNYFYFDGVLKYAERR